MLLAIRAIGRPEVSGGTILGAAAAAASASGAIAAGPKTPAAARPPWQSSARRLSRGSGMSDPPRGQNQVSTVGDEESRRDPPRPPHRRLQPASDRKHLADDVEQRS